MIGANRTLLQHDLLRSAHGCLREGDKLDGISNDIQKYLENSEEVSPLGSARPHGTRLAELAPALELTTG